MSVLSNYPPFRNQLLAKLSLEDLDLLRPPLKPVRSSFAFPRNREMNRSSMSFSLKAIFLGGRQGRRDRETEVAIIGREGVTGLPMLLGDEQSLSRSGRMPRYFFHIPNNHERLDDLEGTELASPEAAHEEAVSPAIELICQRLEAGWYQSGQKIFASSIAVSDEAGGSICTFPFAEVLSRG